MKLDYPEWYYYREEVHMHLRKVVEINPNYIEKIKSDSDLDLFRKDFDYINLLGYTINDDEDIKIYLSNWIGIWQDQVLFKL